METVAITHQPLQQGDSPLLKAPLNRNKKFIGNRKFAMRIEGHRGAGYMEPENSIKAFKKAIELGLDGVELDVWLTKDNVPIIAHGIEGQFVEFINNHKEKICNLTWSDLQTETYILKNGETIPSLAQVLDACIDGVCINIELKEEKTEVMGYILDLLQEKDMLHQISFSSFKHYHRKTLTEEVNRRGIEIHVPFGFLMDVKDPKNPGDAPEKIILPNFEEVLAGDSFNVDIRYLEKHREECLEKLAIARAKKMSIFFWFPMKYTHEDSFYDDLLSIEIDTICTNKPETIVEYLSSRATAKAQLGV